VTLEEKVEHLSNVFAAKFAEYGVDFDEAHRAELLYGLTDLGGKNKIN
jgi:hypothetical protein